MATITTDVEVELDDFSTREIIKELQARFHHMNGIDKEAFRKICREVLKGEFLPEVETLIDKMKVEAFTNGMANKSLEEIEAFFK